MVPNVVASQYLRHAQHLYLVLGSPGFLGVLALRSSGWPGAVGATCTACRLRGWRSLLLLDWRRWSAAGGLSQGCPDFQKVYVFKVLVPFSCPIYVYGTSPLPCKCIQAPPSNGNKSFIESLPPCCYGLHIENECLCACSTLPGPARQDPEGRQGLVAHCHIKIHGRSCLTMGPKMITQTFLGAPYRTILRYYRCDTPYRAILFKGC